MDYHLLVGWLRIGDVNGGMVSLSYPISPSESRISRTSLYKLRRRKGLMAICSGEGRGSAVLVKLWLVGALR